MFLELCLANLFLCWINFYSIAIRIKPFCFNNSILRLCLTSSSSSCFIAILSDLIYFSSHKFVRVSKTLFIEIIFETAVSFVNFFNRLTIYGTIFAITTGILRLSIIPLARISTPSSLSRIFPRIYSLWVFR